MKIGVIGLGNIAQKAYLPVMAAMQQKIDWILCTRNKQKRQELQAKYHFPVSTAATLDELLEKGIDACFVHTPTHTHYDIVKMLLNQGVHVFVDKPLSEEFEEVRELVQLAQKKQLILQIGFNRRYAPFVQRLKLENHDTFLLQKNRINHPLDRQYGIYDLFIHLVDTAVFLLGDPAQTQLAFQTETLAGKQLQSIQIQLKNEKKNAWLSMNLTSGANIEWFQAMQPAMTQQVLDLSTLETYQDGQKRLETFDDWVPTLEKRGFIPMVNWFVEQLECKKMDEDALVLSVASHKICAEISKNVCL